MTWTGVGAGAEIMDKGGAEKDPEPKIKNFGSATLADEYIIDVEPEVLFLARAWVGKLSTKSEKLIHLFN